MDLSEEETSRRQRQPCLIPTLHSGMRDDTIQLSIWDSTGTVDRNESKFE
jgi:hypothetical protein